MTSEEVALAAADLATVEQLRAKILEWEDAYDRLAGAFDLRMAIDEFHASLSDYAGGFYDVVLGELAAQAERAETSRKAWTELGAQAQADAAALRHVLRLAQPDVCSLNCPSTWKTADGPPPHSAKCQAISAALERDAGAALLAELSAARPRSSRSSARRTKRSRG